MDIKYEDLPKTWMEYRKLRRRILLEEYGIEEVWVGELPLDFSGNEKNYPHPNEDEIRARTLEWYKAMKTPGTIFELEKRVQIKPSSLTPSFSNNKEQKEFSIMEYMLSLVIVFCKWFIYSFLFFFAIDTIKGRNRND